MGATLMGTATINQLCLCGQNVTNSPYVFTECRSCCKRIEATEKLYYRCNAKPCRFREITGSYFVVCNTCYESSNEESVVCLNPEPSPTFIKITSLMQNTKRELTECKENDETRRYMFWVYFILYQHFIAKLPTSSDKAAATELKQIKKRFWQFYTDVMHQIKLKIDSKQLGLDSDIFVNKSNMKDEEWAQASKIALDWRKMEEKVAIDDSVPTVPSFAKLRGLIHCPTLNGSIVQLVKYEIKKERYKCKLVNDGNVNEKLQKYLGPQKSLGVREENLELRDCVNINRCQARKRIQFLMRIYKEYFLKRFVYDGCDVVDLHYIDIFENALDDYTPTELLNDYFHVERYHGNDKEIRDCIHDHDDSNGDDNICCALLWRNRRESRYSWYKDQKTNGNNEIFVNYLKTLDKTQIIILEISSKIHTAINHTGKQPLNSGNTASVTTYNKFVNEMNIESKDNKHTQSKHEIEIHIDDLLVHLHKNGLSIKECNAFMNAIIANEYDTEALVDDLSNGNDACNHYKESQIYQVFLQNKYGIKLIKKYLNINQNDDEKVDEFVLGRSRVYYWKYHEKRVRPKYASLKKECINNAIHNMDIKTFYEVLEKAVTYSQSCEAKHIKSSDRSNENNKYEIPVGLPLTISHILVLMMYCNCNELQRKYKKYGCRESNRNETEKEFMERNKEIGNWYKLLYEVVMCYGTIVKQGEIFYTGINVPVSFTTYTPWFNCPFSTTTEWHAANSFSEGKGIILRLEPGLSSVDRYFDVEWLSNYKEERERLFCHCHSLNVTDIQYRYKNKIQYNDKYMDAFRLWSAIFNGYYFIFTKGKETDQMLIYLIVNYKQNNGVKSTVNVRVIDIHIYIQQLFYHLVHHLGQKEHIRMIPSEYSLLSKSLRNELLSIKPLSLFPFLTSLNFNASKIQFLEEYTWTLSEEQLDKLKNGQKDIHVTSDTYDYTITTKNSAITFDLELWDQSSNIYTAFGFGIKHISSLSKVSGTFSIAVNELKWLKNRWPFHNLLEGQSKNIKFFESDSLNDLQSLTLRLSVLFY